MKKTLKILLTILLLLAVSFGIAGCGKDKQEKETKNNKDVQTNIVEPKNNENSQSNTKQFSRGSWDGDVYTNEYLGLKFNLPSGWNKTTDEELASLSGMATDMLTDSEEAKAEIDKYMETSSLYGMMAKDDYKGDNVIIQFEKVPNGTTENTIVNNLKQQLQSAQGMSFKAEEVTTERLCGKQYSLLTASNSYNGVEMVQNIYISIDGEYASYIIITLTDSSRMNSVLSNFSEI